MRKSWLHDTPIRSRSKARTRALRLECARREDLDRYIDLLEEVAAWCGARHAPQWELGTFRRSANYYASSIEKGEVQLVFSGAELVATIRLLLSEPIVWPEAANDEAVYVFNLVVRRTWAHRGLGRDLLRWAEHRASLLGRAFVRLDCFPDNEFLKDYYLKAGFEERGEIDARFPEPVGMLRLKRFEKRIRAASTRGSDAPAFR